jgi:hypothetical protein
MVQRLGLAVAAARARLPVVFAARRMSRLGI